MSRATITRSPGQDMALTETLHIATLLQWMSEARHILRQVQMAAKLYPELEQILKRQDIRYGLAWETEQQEAESGLFYELRDRIETLPEAGS